ncbi:SIMPL domain-containing protein [Pseudooctadecabacter jejudonensis]|uniref:26 kDa periplasmic immunogenic protein n=1 Tax=Pseudooctadecabacter jejudonensis TaxID=1391910 RepID=A0A1Y5RM23_9RHOB|nr:SIMPL domain-containing protein [Pseudooctadecabacter jejudonensis]SLN20665.1 26 kDa periplasmic immunogenic protein precursor [Pseudooctadecabacter jejudonensis]
MMRSFVALMCVVATLVLAGVSAKADEAARTISVTGMGEVSLPPDMATIRLGVQTEGEAAAQALDAASAATLAILGRLDAEGVAAADVQSGAVQLRPRYSNSVISSGQQIVGYHATNTVVVQVRDLDDLGGLLAALVGDGANRLDGVSFGLQDPSAAMDEARRRAVADALARAALYAEASGVAVGDVLQIAEQGAPQYRALRAEPVMMEAMASAPSFDVPVAAGEIEVSASINMVFGMDD